MKPHACLILTVGLLLAADDPTPLARLKKKAENDFFVLDRSGDGFLSRDEMPDDLKAELSKWDTNRDNLISLDEFAYYHANHGQSRRDHAPATSPVIVHNEEDLEGRPVVFRAGKLPERALPKWFVQLDTDDDGQVSLSEWHKGGYALDSFRDWDRNDDGFITPEEALYRQRLIEIVKARPPAKHAKTPAAKPAAALQPPASTAPDVDLARDDRANKAKKDATLSKLKGRG
jgi:hypothetical protein